MKDRLISLIGESWFNEVGHWFTSEDSKKLIRQVNLLRKQVEVFPSKDDVFNALKYCSYENTKILILAQDPFYYKVKDTPVAHGLAFSSQVENHIPKSLKVIFEELDLEYNHFPPNESEQSPNLIRWAEQGVLLLNTSLTVTKGKPNSHRDFGWNNFVKIILDSLVKKENIVYMFWGAEAKRWETVVNRGKNSYILKAAHPAVHAYTKSLPKSSDDPKWSAKKCFLGCDHFKKANEFLKAMHKDQILWIEDKK